MAELILGFSDSEEVAISQIFPLNNYGAKVKKLNGWQIVLFFFHLKLTFKILFILFCFAEWPMFTMCQSFFGRCDIEGG
ncbi:hypothetical protein [Gelidibacter pelagius]|uniref:Uncharacterized protein n=1 Tax=Gelidibacter pelagius TaxID=2819985 RepID=A0ABS3SQG2_9FLAO|nr:hypothetical protein [Gelidibacter pelagius]MBO3097192.1 hypothetical protein [Gelidibacter pelagius]